MDMLATAIIQTSFGVKGEVKVRPFNDDCSYLGQLKEGIILLKDGRELPCHIDGFRMSGSQALMKIRGIDTPEEAKKLSGATLQVPRSEAAPLEDGEYYVADLIGCTLVHGGLPMATVVDVFEGSQSLMLEAADGKGKKYLVPKMDRYVADVNLEAKTIELLTPWLLA